MYDLPNRKQRRAIMKQLGLLKKKSKMTLNAWSDEVVKNNELGNEMHRQKSEEILREQDEKLAEKNYVD